MRINFLLLFLAVIPSIYAQNQLHGKITDASNGEPVFSANIYFPKLEKGAVSDLDGSFTIKNLPDGNYEILISSIGYTTLSREITLPSEELEITLEPSAVEMEEIIISTPFHQLQSENVMKVDRENVSQLEKRGALSLSDGITQMAGVESLTTGVGIGKPVIRGLSSNRVLVYTQGVRLENQQYGDEHGLGISSKGIGSVEVIKGPASLLYGSDAIGGVLYLNPEPYAVPDLTSAQIETDFFSNTLGFQGSAMAKTSGEKFKFLARGSYAAHSDYKTGNGDRVTNTRFNEKDLKTGIGFQNAKYKADFRYNYNNSEIGIPEEIGIQSTEKEPLLPYQNIDNHILSLDNRLYFKNSSLDAKLGYQYNNRQEFEEHDHAIERASVTSSEEPSLEMHLKTFNYNIKYNLPELGNFQTIVGVQGMNQDNSNFGEEVLIPDATTKDFGIFGTAHFHLTDWDFQGGLRYDLRNIKTEIHGNNGDSDYFAPIDRSFSSINTALGAKYQYDKRLIARLNFATGFRAPNLSELTSNGTHSGANRYEIGNPDLENEQNLQADLALEWRGKHFEAYINGFHNSVSNYIYINPTGQIRDENAVFQYVQNDAKLYGGEIGIHLHPHPLDWLHLESSFETVTGKLNNGDYLPLIPANSITNTFRVEFVKGEFLKDKFAFISLKNIFDKENVGQFETHTGGYGLLNAGLGTQIDLGKNELSFNISANNLLDRNYISHLSRLKADDIQNIGRNVKLSVSWVL